MQFAGKLGFLAILAMAAIGMASFAGASTPTGPYSGDCDGSADPSGGDFSAIIHYLSGNETICSITDYDIFDGTTYYNEEDSITIMDITKDGKVDKRDLWAITGMLAGGHDNDDDFYYSCEGTPSAAYGCGWGGPKDCDDSDASINPTTVPEVYGNGIDEDCSGAGLVLSGDIYDELSSPLQKLSHAKITATCYSDAETYATTSGDDGRYALNINSTGCQIVVSKDGFYPSDGYYSSSFLTTYIGTITRDFSLQVSDKDADNDDYDAVKYGGNDCDDTSAAVKPGAAEICNGVDDDCDAGTADGSGEAAPLNTNQLGVCLGSVQSCGGAAGWANNYVGIASAESPGNGIDEDCDGADQVIDGYVDDGRNKVYGTWVSLICDYVPWNYYSQNMASMLTGGIDGNWGYYLFNLIQPYTNCHMSASKDGYDPYDSASIFDIGVGWMTEDVPLTESTIYAGHFTGTVYDQIAGAPRAGAYVNLIRSDPLEIPELVQKVKADASGYFEIHGVPAGHSYNLTAEDTGCTFISGPTGRSVSPGATEDVGIIFLNCP